MLEKFLVFNFIPPLNNETSSFACIISRILFCGTLYLYAMTFHLDYELTNITSGKCFQELLRIIFTNI